jgi:hypothetical protein
MSVGLKVFVRFPDLRQQELQVRFDDTIKSIIDKIHPVDISPLANSRPPLLLPPL